MVWCQRLPANATEQGVRQQKIIMGFFSRIFGTDKQATRGKALELGIVVEDVNRKLPSFGRYGSYKGTINGSCVRYSIARRNSANSLLKWALLQRTEDEGQLRNGWLHKPSEIPGDLMIKFEEIITEFDEEYFEFEATETEVSVFWEEWGGPKQVQRVFSALEKLAN